jgi:5,6,7,8-tetrahydromethanopterin hydro-lyase
MLYGTQEPGKFQSIWCLFVASILVWSRKNPFFWGRQGRISRCKNVAVCYLFVFNNAQNAKTPPSTLEFRNSSMSMYVGESLVGEGNEIAHIDLLIGSKDGPVGTAFANALATQSSGHTNLLITKVTIKGMKQAVQMFGPAQAAVAKAVADSVASGVIPKDQAENLVIVCGVFIHPAAADDKKIYQYNYEATVDAISNALKGLPTVQQVVDQKDTAAHPFRGF